MRERDIDRYGRIVGEVILPDGRSLNRELAKAGLVVVPEVLPGTSGNWNGWRLS